jgi:hypothetical protein
MAHLAYIVACTQFIQQSRKVSLATGNQGHSRYLKYRSFTVLSFETNYTHVRASFARDIVPPYHGHSRKNGNDRQKVFH